MFSVLKRDANLEIIFENSKFLMLKNAVGGKKHFRCTHHWLFMKIKINLDKRELKNISTFALGNTVELLIIKLMKKLSLFFMLLLSVSILKAQDKIITLNGDTINCKILPKRGAGHSWLIGVSSGISNLPWMLDNVINTGDTPDFYDEIKTGFHVNANVHHMVFGFGGIGLQYSYLNSKREGTYQTMIDSYYPTYTSLTEERRQYLNYIGASLIFQQYLDKNRKFQISETFSYGGLFYRAEDQASILEPPYYSGDPYSSFAYNSVTTGFSWAGKFGLSVEYKVLPCLSIGLGGDMFLAWLSKDNQNSKGKSSYSMDEEIELENTRNINLSHIDCSLALRFHF